MFLNQARVSYRWVTGIIYLQRIFSGFPDGIRGIALLSLRSAAAFLLIHDSAIRWTSDSQTVISALTGFAGFCLIAGAFTPAVGLIAAGLEFWKGGHDGWSSWSFSLLLISVLVALAALGPGAFSVDGWLFGRKKITIGPPHS
jgi:uncharacterized membrane protein YphA (DoxX/SURF4 family)